MSELPEFMTDYRSIAREILEYVGGGPESWGDQPGEVSSQRQITNDVYAKGLIEGRKYKPPASSCGDLPHCMYYRLGVRLSFVNREEFNGWEFMGVKNNITRITAKTRYGTNPYAKASTDQDVFECGDVLIVNVSTPSTTHAICVLEHDPVAGTIKTAESGQPGSAVRFKTCVRDNGRWKIGKRHVDSVLRLSDVILAAYEAEKLESYETAEDWARRKGLTLPGVFVMGMRSRLIKRAQDELKKRGDSSVGTSDGVFGSGTLAAINRFQKSNNITVTGELDHATIAALGV